MNTILGRGSPLGETNWFSGIFSIFEMTNQMHFKYTTSDIHSTKIKTMAVTFYIRNRKFRKFPYHKIFKLFCSSKKKS